MIFPCQYIVTRHAMNTTTSKLVCGMFMVYRWPVCTDHINSEQVQTKTVCIYIYISLQKLNCQFNTISLLYWLQNIKVIIACLWCTKKTIINCISYTNYCVLISFLPQQLLQAHCPSLFGSIMGMFMHNVFVVTIVTKGLMDTPQFVQHAGIGQTIDNYCPIVAPHKQYDGACFHHFMVNYN